jgi:sulfotransferase family protein
LTTDPGHLVRGAYRRGRKLARHLPGRGRLLPDFLVIGAPRCGTTSVHGWLNDHPLVAPTPKEILFFNIHYASGPDWYRDHFPTERERSRFTSDHGRPFLTGDATASYMLHHWTPERAARLLPEAKVIACLRDPVDRTYSQFHAARRRGYEPLESFEDAIAQEPGRIAADERRVLAEPDYVSTPLHVWAHVKQSRYVEQLERWFEFFPRERMLLVNFDRDLSADPRRGFVQIQEFLGLPPHTQAQLPVLNRDAEAYEPMAERTRSDLTEYFRPFNRRLCDLTGVDFGWPA